MRRAGKNPTGTLFRDHQKDEILEIWSLLYRLQLMLLSTPLTIVAQPDQNDEKGMRTGREGIGRHSICTGKVYKEVAC